METVDYFAQLKSQLTADRVYLPQWRWADRFSSWDFYHPVF
ncbi:hypothetical protein SAMN02982990_03689 [Photorhabdus luminescens]|uniref:Uncharacterized protein n=1 Tax=Photorhabdus luminescens TaxID=29488 RepID=A0A1G5RBA1_PHOLU|nr:hypothetical protein SAMN02982990_03689 [Photorhabdus luminescens]